MSSDFNLIETMFRAQFGKGVELHIMKAIWLREHIATTLQSESPLEKRTEAEKALDQCRKEARAIQALVARIGNMAVSEEEAMRQKRIKSKVLRRLRCLRQEVMRQNWAKTEAEKALDQRRKEVRAIQADLAAKIGDIAASEKIRRHELRYQKWLKSEWGTLSPKATIVIHAIMTLGDATGNLPTVAEVEDLIRAVIMGKDDNQRRRRFITLIERIANKHAGFERHIATQRAKEWKRDLVKSNFSGLDLQIRRVCREWGIPLQPGG
jgi:hypothetical protein